MKGVPVSDWNRGCMRQLPKIPAHVSFAWPDDRFGARTKPHLLLFCWRNLGSRRASSCRGRRLDGRRRISDSNRSSSHACSLEFLP